MAGEIIVVFELLCKTAHENLLAGKCPWCGQVVINGRTVPSESTSDPLRPPSLLHLRLRLLLLVWRTITIPIAIVATGIAFVSSWSLVTAVSVGLGVFFTVTITMLVTAVGVVLRDSDTVTTTMLGTFLWHAARTIRRPNMKRRNDGIHQAGNRNEK